MELEEDSPLLTGARARVTWGDPVEDVTAWVAAQGMPHHEAAALVRSLHNERIREVRFHSRRKLALGIGLLSFSIIFFALLPWEEWMRALNQYFTGRTRKGPGDWLLYGALWAAISGVWLCWRGFWGLVTPAAEELSDVE
jgi:hypothetical protein